MDSVTAAMGATHPSGAGRAVVGHARRGSASARAMRQAQREVPPRAAPETPATSAFAGGVVTRRPALLLAA